MTDVVERLNSMADLFKRWPLYVADIESRVVNDPLVLRLAAAEIEQLRAALTEIACFNDKSANARLKETGSWGAFDEPGSVQIARAALKGKRT